jgi:hypothetical protein
VSSLHPAKRGVGQKGERGNPASFRREGRAWVPSQIFSEYWGITPQLWRELSAKKAIRAFCQQRTHAEARAVPFNLTLTEWWDIWKASGKWEMRGRGVGRYCMSRFADQGPYEVGNVHIQLSQMNSREAACQWAGRTKKHKCVFRDLPGTAKPYSVKVRGHRLGRFATEEEAVAARDAFLAKGG